MLVTRLRRLPHKPFCLPTHSHFHQLPPPSLHSSSANETTQRPINYRVHSISLILQHPPLHRPYITIKTKIRQPKAGNLIKKSHQRPTSMKSHTQKKHEISSEYLVRKFCSKKTYNLIWTSRNGQKAFASIPHYQPQTKKHALSKANLTTALKNEIS